MTTASFSIDAGNVLRATIAFTPASGTVSLGDVSCRYIRRDGSVVTVSGIAADAANTFHADVDVPDNEPEGWWQFRWESNAPSPKIALEDDTTRVAIVPSIFPSP